MKRTPQTRPGIRTRLEHAFSARFSRKFRATADTLATVLPALHVALDIGASQGKFTKEMQRIWGRNCRIYCFEPLPYNRSVLRGVIRNWRNVEIVPLALSDEAGDIELQVPYKPSGRIAPGSTHVETHRPVPLELRHFRWQTVPARALTLDDFVRERALDAVDFMKIDVEGAVPLVLKGGTETLRRFRPAIFAEIGRITASNFGFVPEDTIRLLAAQGYAMHRLDLERRRAVPQAYYEPSNSDYLFLPS